MNSKKRIIISIVACFAVLVLSIAGSFAYLVSAQWEDNNIGIGGNTVDIVEEFNPPPELNVGINEYDKEIRIKNNGEGECFIRLFLAFGDGEVENVSEVSSDNRNSYQTLTELKNNPPEGWTFLNDEILGGYFYYMSPVNAGESTTPLITDVKTNFVTAEDIKQYEILVYTESVQTRDINGELFTGEAPWKQAWTEFISRK